MAIVAVASEHPFIDRFGLLLDYAKTLAKSGDYLGALIMIEEATIIIARVPGLTEDDTNEAV